MQDNLIGLTHSNKCREKADLELLVDPCLMHPKELDKLLTVSGIEQGLGLTWAEVMLP